MLPITAGSMALAGLAAPAIRLIIVAFSAQSDVFRAPWELPAKPGVVIYPPLA